jgi:hypothetical protein
MIYKREVKVVPVHAMKAYTESSTHSEPRLWMEMIGQLHAPAALPTGTNPVLSSIGEAMLAREPVWTMWRKVS